jgi:cell fate regulator YaaT (PSP1 superfamily)
MATVVGVVFQPGGKVYSFDPGGLELRWDERVICQTARGREYGRIVETEREVPDDSLTGPLKRVVRRAVPADEQVIEQNRVEAKRGMLLFRELSKGHGLELKPVSSEVTFDGSRITFAFSAEERPDTRSLQNDLGERLKRRVDLRQVGPREQGRLCGAVGLCGTNQLCSARYPCHDQPITLKMAKDQQLPMNPGRITGLCGRLRCCLAFEHPLYRSFRDRAPAVGRMVATPEGKGIVRSYEVLRDACVVELDGRTMMELKLDEVVEVAG